MMSSNEPRPFSSKGFVVPRDAHTGGSSEDDGENDEVAKPIEKTRGKTGKTVKKTNRDHRKVRMTTWKETRRVSKRHHTGY